MKEINQKKGNRGKKERHGDIIERGKEGESKKPNNPRKHPT